MDNFFGKVNEIDANNVCAGGGNVMFLWVWAVAVGFLSLLSHKTFLTFSISH
jgi:hypothetical protein